MMHIQRLTNLLLIADGLTSLALKLRTVPKIDKQVLEISKRNAQKPPSIKYLDNVCKLVNLQAI